MAGFEAILPSTDFMGALTVEAGQFSVQLDAEDVQREEFNIRIRTGSRTVLQSVRVTWIAHHEA